MSTHSFSSNQRHPLHNSVIRNRENYNTSSDVEEIELLDTSIPRFPKKSYFHKPKPRIYDSDDLLVCEYHLSH